MNSPFFLQENAGTSFITVYKREKSCLVKMISYYSGAAIMVPYAYNPGLQVCVREGWDLKWSCVKRKIKTSVE